MRVDSFDFALPRSLIADRPAEPRDEARLLVVGEGLEDRGMRDLPSLLAPGRYAGGERHARHPGAALRPARVLRRSR